MRVHHITNDYSLFTGGAQRVVRFLHRGLKDRGIESFILGLMQQNDLDLEEGYSLGLESPYDFRAISGINRYIIQNVQPNDVVHVHLFPPLFYVSLLKLLKRVHAHLICTEHSTYNRRRNTLLGWMLDMVTYTGYERIVAISAGVEQELQKWKPGLIDKTQVIYNGVDLPFEHVIERTAKPRLTVLSVGNLRPAKNYFNILRAIALLTDLDFEYLIAGAGEQQEQLVHWCRDLGIESRVRFLGYVDTIPELLLSADTFLMPSLWEGFGLAAIEAMNASLPLVISDIPGLREIVKSEHPCSLLVNPESPASIADGLKQLLLSKGLRFRLGSRAFVQSQKFSVDQMVENYRKLYAEII